MSGHSEADWTDLRQRVLGMGKDSLHKSHYASLRQRMAELERFRSLIDAASDLLFIVDVPSGRILDVNESACRRLAMAPGEIKAASFERLIAAPGWEQLTATWRRSPEVPDAVVVSEFRTADGKQFPVEIAVRVLPSARGCHGILAARDISERARAEQERANLEEELRQAQRLESLGRLAGGVAHDFNNLLTVITGYSSLLLGGLRTGLSAEKCAAEIHEAAASAARLTRQLLDIGRKQIVRPTSLDMNTLITETSGMLQRLLGEDVVFTTRLAPGLDPVLVDRDQMQHVLINLCVNGRDAMPRGGELTVETRNVEMDEKETAGHLEAIQGRYVLMSVSDTGVGMDEATRSRIFEPFYTTKERGKGTGLGLASVYGIVRQANGLIRVNSKLGQGSCFQVYLPRSERSVPPPAAAPQTAAESRPLRATILVVEDQEEVRTLVTLLLRQEGHHVLAAANGPEALRLAAAYGEPIHLLITDVVLPGPNGREVASQLVAEHPGLKVLYCSGYSTDVIAQRGVLEQGVAYLPKPFAPKTLTARVQALLQEGR